VPAWEARRAGGKGVRPGRGQDVGWVWELQLFAPFGSVSVTEKLATIIDFIEFCTACHAEGCGSKSRRSRHLDAERIILLFSGELGRGVLVV